MKRIIVILILFLASVANGAAQTCTWDGAIDTDWSNAGNWNTTVEADRVPVGGDAVVIGGSVSCNMPNETVPPTGVYTGWDMTGHTGGFLFGGADIDVDGDVVFDNGGSSISGPGTMSISGDLTILSRILSGFTVTMDGTGTIAANVPTNAANLIIDTAAGTYELTTNSYWRNYTQTAGSITGTGFTLFSFGDVVGTAAGTTTNWTIEQTGTGDVSWEMPSDRLLEYRLGASAIVTMTESVYTAKATFASGSSLDAASAKGFFISFPEDDFATLEGTIGSNVAIRIRMVDSRSNSGVIGSDGEVRFESDVVDATWIQTGVMVIDCLKLRSREDNFSSKLVIGVTGCNLGDVVLGTTGGIDRHGILDLGDGNYDVAISSVVDGTDDVSPSNELDLGNATTHLSNTINGDDIAFTAGTAARIAVGDNSVAPKLINVTVATSVDASGVLDGGGNSAIIRFARGMVGGGVF